MVASGLRQWMRQRVHSCSQYESFPLPHVDRHRSSSPPGTLECVMIHGIFGHCINWEIHSNFLPLPAKFRSHCHWRLLQEPTFTRRSVVRMRDGVRHSNVSLWRRPAPCAGLGAELGMTFENIGKQEMFRMIWSVVCVRRLPKRNRRKDNPVSLLSADHCFRNPSSSMTVQTNSAGGFPVTFDKRVRSR